MKKEIYFIVLILFITTSFSINNNPKTIENILVKTGNNFEEKDGIVSMEAENASEYNSFVPVSGISGIAMQLPRGATKQYKERTGYIRFKILFHQIGKYHMFILARKCVVSNDYKYHGNEAQLRIDPDTTIKSAVKRGNNKNKDFAPLYMLPQDETGMHFTRVVFENADGKGIFEWRSLLKTSKPVEGTKQQGNIIINIEKAGWHIIEFIATNESDWAIDKIVLQLNNPLFPIEEGPNETILK